MRARKSKDIQAVLERKGFVLHPDKHHHQFYCLHHNGKKQAIKTYFSHGKREYDSNLMSIIKKQLKFTDTETAERFLDCPMTKEQYIEMLVAIGHISV